MRSLRCVVFFFVLALCRFASFPVVLLSCFNQRGVALAQEQHNGLAPVMVLIVGVVGAVAAVFAFVFSGAVTGIIIFTISFIIMEMLKGAARQVLGLLQHHSSSRNHSSSFGDSVLAASTPNAVTV